VTPTPFRLGSRGSPLARAQAEWVAERMGDGVLLVWIRSEGDQDVKTPLAAMGGTGVFTAALHRALLEDRVDAAVHSLKDLPVAEAPGVVLAAVAAREDPRDALVSRSGLPLARLPAGATVGTGSPRRAAQVLRARPDLRVAGIRGNVDTRLAHVREGRFDAIVLALAGLKRIGREDEATEVLDPEVMLPAPGQGALAVTIRDGDAIAEGRTVRAADVRTAAAVSAERAVLHGLRAGCHAPVGALAEVEGGRIRLRARVLALDGRTSVEENGEGPLAEAAAVGARVAAALLERGAGPLVGGTNA
jgi:hydroxymethylbilane synthase